jgi:hypothetical protein
MAEPDLPLAIVYSAKSLVLGGALKWGCHCEHQNLTKETELVRCEKCGLQYRVSVFVALTPIVEREG